MINIYQIFTRLYGNTNSTNIPNGTIEQNGCAKLNDFTHEQLKRISNYGFSHVWFTGLLEHATQTDYSAMGIDRDHPAIVKGKAGSPYAIKDYYDIDPDLATDVSNRMGEFEALLARTHQAGLKMIIDFVPNHTARNYHSDARPFGVRDLGEDDNRGHHFNASNNYYYCPDEPLHTDHILSAQGCEEPYVEFPARATGNDHFDAWPRNNDWYETAKLNYGIDYCGGGHRQFFPVPDTWDKMTEILLFWASKGVDAFRCDMAEMVPVEFWHYAIGNVKEKFPEVQFIAEVYNPEQYRSYIHHGRFDYLYDKVGLYDSLRAVVCGNAPASCLTQTWQSVDDIRKHMLYFLENHDEQRIASKFFCGEAELAFPALVVAALLGDNPLMVYAGQELGEKGMEAEGFSGMDGRTTIFDYWSPNTLRKLTANKLRLTTNEQRCYDYYKQVLLIRNTEPAAKGPSYDLMYVNYEGSEGFDPTQMYAFLRDGGKHLLLVVANFGDKEAKSEVRIPTHAFEFLSMKEGKRSATDLLTGKKTTIQLAKDKHCQICVPQHGAVVLKFLK